MAPSRTRPLAKKATSTNDTDMPTKAAMNTAVRPWLRALTCRTGSISDEADAMADSVRRSTETMAPAAPTKAISEKLAITVTASRKARAGDVGQDAGDHQRHEQPAQQAQGPAPHAAGQDLALAAEGVEQLQPLQQAQGLGLQLRAVASSGAKTIGSSLAALGPTAWM
jgi:hypothetical protein